MRPMRPVRLPDLIDAFLSCLPLLCCLAFAVPAHAAASPKASVLYPIPAEVRSTHYIVTVNGSKTPVVHAASSYYLLNFDADFSKTGPVMVSVTADDAHFWDRGVEVQPMRLGIRPVRRGPTISFPLAGPEKITISRPGDHFAEADMLFLFANDPDTSRITAQTPGIRYYGPGVHRGSINAESGDTIYLAGGAVVFGSLNLWQVHDVRVLGRGMIVYDGPQNPADDEGWMHKRDWHAIVMDKAHNIEIDGITTVVRSRTWQIQMKDSRNIGFYNVKVVAGTRGDANQDGMDWLGGGDTTVRDSFFRASDDVFALQSNWEGYGGALRLPGHDVTNITIENTVASTSISNTVRVGWPTKVFSSAHFHMRDVDVIHTGFGECKVPFAFFELWDDPDGVGTHTDYRFEDIRLDDWYSLFQIRHPSPSVRGVSFRGVWAMDGPGMVPSTLKGDVRGVTVADVPELEGEPAQVSGGAAPVEALPAEVDAGYSYTPGLLRPKHAITFTATAADATGRRFHWLFGDGTTAEGRVVRHSFADGQGTLLDGSGRFRVLLHVTETDGAQSWTSQPVMVFPTKPQLKLMEDMYSPDTYQTDWLLAVPAAGGYTFTLLSSAQATLAIDSSMPVESPTPRAKVCGAEASAVQPVRMSVALAAGKHNIQVRSSQTGVPLVLWEGPGVARQPLPAPEQTPR